MGSLSPMHWLIVIGVLVLLFGAKKLPDLARSVGQSARVLKGEMKGLKDDPADPADAPAPPPAPPAVAARDHAPVVDRDVPVTPVVPVVPVENSAAGSHRSDPAG